MGQVEERKPLDLDAAVAQVRETIERYRVSEGTKKTYVAWWSRFTEWCGEHKMVPLPAAPETVAMYLIDHMGLIDDNGALRISRRSSQAETIVAAIRYEHNRKDLPTPTDDPLVRGLLDAMATADQPEIRKAKPLPLSLLEEVAASPLTYPQFTRDWAMVTLGFFGAFRGCEVVRLRRSDLNFTGEGVVVTIRRSKENPMGYIEHVPIARRDSHLCPVEIIEEWIDQLTDDEFDGGWLFPASNPTRHLSDRTLYEAVRRVTNNGNAEGSEYSSHSLRRGFCTEAVARGHSITQVALKTRHRNIQTTVGYVEATLPRLAQQLPNIWGGT